MKTSQKWSRPQKWRWPQKWSWPQKWRRPQKLKRPQKWKRLQKWIGLKDEDDLKNFHSPTYKKFHPLTNSPHPSSFRKNYPCWNTHSSATPVRVPYLLGSIHEVQFLALPNNFFSELFWFKKILIKNILSKKLGLKIVGQ